MKPIISIKCKNNEETEILQKWFFERNIGYSISKTPFKIEYFHNFPHFVFLNSSCIYHYNLNYDNFFTFSYNKWLEIGDELMKSNILHEDFKDKKVFKRKIKLKFL